MCSRNGFAADIAAEGMLQELLPHVPAPRPRSQTSLTQVREIAPRRSRSPQEIPEIPRTGLGAGSTA